MDHNRVRNLLENVSAGKVTVEEALGKLRSLPFEDLGFARLDSHRSLRQGFPEVVYCEGKTTEQLTLIARQMLAAGGPIMFTRANLEAYQAIHEVAPEAVYYEDASIVVVNSEPIESILSSGTVLVVTGGTTDIPVAEEAAVTAEIMGNKVDRMYDVGVAGLHRSPPLARRIGEAIRCQRFGSGSRHGGSPGQRCGRSGGCASDRSANQRRLRSELRWLGSSLNNAQQLRSRRGNGQYRQRLLINRMSEGEK
jgi:hypothetical protein